MIDSFLDAWTQMTQAQATVIAGVLTILAAVFGVMLGNWLFGGRVKTMKGALDETEQKVKQALAKTEEDITVFSTSMEEQMGALMQVVGELRTKLGDLDDGDGRSAGDGVNDLEQGVPSRDRLKALWHSIRDRIEELAASPEINGRTRAKYSRISRYSYAPLISAMQHDGRINADWNSMHAANDIWQNYQRRDAQPSVEEFNKMVQLQAQLVKPH